MSERLTPHFAVFNLHVNGAKEKADAEFKSQFGEEAFDKFIAPLHEGGIMAIFNQKPSKYTLPWVTLCTYFVNDREGVE